MATGGNAANGINGTNGGNASYDTTSGNHVRTGSGGRGGDGGGGAGAGIGTSGGNGGTGGTDVKGLDYAVSGEFSWYDNTGNAGNNGTNGGTAADMGTLYIYHKPAPTTEIHGGREFYGERYGGSGGLHALMNYETFLAGDWVMTMAGGAGGGAGGGGGASGSIAARNSASAFYQVGAKGGQGGVYANGTRAGDGETTLMWSCEDRYMAQMPRKHDYMEEVQYTNDGWYDNVDHSADGGSGGSAGAAARSGSAIIVGREWPAQGEGTEEAPYLISNTETWDIFTEFVNTGTNFSGQYVKLTEDISVVTMAGGSETRGFHGTFDGAGHTLTFTASDQTEKFVAPFRCVGGNATIKNLKTAGSIKSNNMYATGLIASIEKSAENSPAVTVENCRSSMAISNSGSGDLTLSGLVGRLENASLTISGCVFDGSLAGRNATGNAGFVSWIAPNSNVNIKDCLFAPSSLSTSTDLCATIARKDDDTSAVLTITNCYFTKALGTEQGTKAVAATSIPVGLGSPSTEYGMVTVYANGIYCDGTYYGTFATISLADNADNSTTISDANGYVADVTLTGRTFYRDGAWNTLCLPFNATKTGPLATAVIKELDTETAYDGHKSGFEDGTLYLNFKDAENIVAGQPYIVKWNAVSQEHFINPSDEVIAAPDFITEVPTFDGGLESNWWTKHGPEKLVDGNTATKYGLSNANPWVEFHYTKPITPKGYALMTADNTEAYGSRNPKSWTIKAKNSGDADWTTLTTVDNTNKDKLPTANNKWTIFLFDNSTAYQYFRFEAENNSEFQLAELRFCTMEPGRTEIENPTFETVTIQADAPTAVTSEDGKVSFAGSYDPVSIAGEERSVLYLSDNNTLYYPNAAMTIGAFRAHFQLNGLTAGEPTSPVRAFVLNFGDGERNDNNASGIITTNFTNPTNSDNEWYTLDGRKLNGKPTQRGIYINNGRKVAVK